MKVYVHIQTHIFACVCRLQLVARVYAEYQLWLIMTNSQKNTQKSFK